MQRAPAQGNLMFGYDSLLELPVCSFSGGKKADLSELSPEEQSKVEVRTLADGRVNYTIKGVLSAEAENQIAGTLDGKEKTVFKKTMELRRYQEARKDCPAVQGIPFAVPQLCLEIDGFKDIASEDVYMESGWRISDCLAELPGFQIKEENDRFLIDIQGGRVIEQFIGKGQTELDLDEMKIPWTEDRLVGWLDSHLRQPGLRQADLCKFIRKMVQHLRDERGIGYATQQRFVFLLQKAFADRIAECRKDAQRKGYQAALFAPDALVSADENFRYEFTPSSYPAHWHYSGSYQFNKHYFPTVGELKSQGEEFDCAKAIDRNLQVKFWVRNLERRDSCAFSLPVSTGRFYPDFIARLEDGRVVVVEYKGEHLAAMESEKEKASIGRLWEQKSNGKALFLFAVKRDETGRDVAGQINSKL
jgi:type III restriction enzyme